MKPGRSRGPLLELRAWAAGFVLGVFLVGGSARPLAGAPVSPLFYHTYARVTAEAQVESLCVVGERVVDTDQWLRLRKPPEQSLVIRPLQRIELLVLRVLSQSVSSSDVSLLRSGDLVVPVNPFLDQSLPFGVGQTILVRLRFVGPEAQYRPGDPRAQWWFAPPAQPEEIAPPRRPFEGIELMSTP